MAPTKTLASLASLFIRQDPPTATVTVVQQADDGNGNGGGNDHLSTGAIVGIVIGVIVGLILLWWIFKSLSRDKNSRMAPAPDRQAYDPDMPPAAMYRSRSSRSRSAHRSRSRGHHHHHHRHSSRSRSRPVVYDDKMYVATPVQPAAVYTYPDRRSRSRSRSRY
ncbi:hypothetical protein B0H65DRAFT_155559 [Neurospora tetraspora]|uniref:Uncharacterized protein n=1 Tax=Neurospora tetraspora TaxID=94610 RepID=A0AAE0MSR1_9PEZI|nr:hypothetical protein B0H65DRAFT_155559 [Neurospora tetraspora]